MTGAIAGTSCPHVRRLSELWCAGCLSPLGAGEYEARCLPFYLMGGATTIRTVLLHPRCVDGYACDDAIGRDDQLIRGLK